MTADCDKEHRFKKIVDEYQQIIAKVCTVYAGANASFDDLYQETMINLWQGLDSFRGEAKISTWIYRTALNTCITWYRRNNRHIKGRTDLENIISEPGEDSSSRSEDLRQLYTLIRMLSPFEKAIITLWLDERPYEEIASITGLSKPNVAVKIHRIKDKLAKFADR